GRSKGTAYESGVRVSMAIRGPGITPGSTSDEPVHTLDLFSTILNLARLEVPETVPNSDGSGSTALDSVSLAPVLLGDAASVRDPYLDYLLSETVNPVQNNLRQVAARNVAYKLICNEKADAA